MKRSHLNRLKDLFLLRWVVIRETQLIVDVAAESPNLTVVVKEESVVVTLRGRDIFNQLLATILFPIRGDNSLR